MLSNQRHGKIHQVNNYFVIDFFKKEKNGERGKEVKRKKKKRKPLSDPITFLYLYLYFRKKKIDTVSHSILEKLAAHDLDGCII